MTDVQKKTLGLAIASLVFGCLMIIPLLGILCSVAAVTLGIVALVKISKNKDTLKGQGMAIAGIVLGGIGVAMIPIVALLAAIAIPNLLRARINADEAGAMATVKMVSTALGTYAAANNGQYPLSEEELVKNNYVSEPVSGTQKYGYTYTVGLQQGGYEIVANPVTCGASGTKVFKARQDGVIMEEQCRKY